MFSSLCTLLPAPSLLPFRGDVSVIAPKSNNRFFLMPSVSPLCKSPPVTTLYILWMVCLPMFLHVCAAKEMPLIAGLKKKINNKKSQEP